MNPLLGIEESTLGVLSIINDYRSTHPFAGGQAIVSVCMVILNRTGWPRAALRRIRANLDAASLSDSGCDTSKGGLL